MSQQTVERTDQPALVFDGELFATARTDVHGDEANSRWFQLTLYNCRDGGFVTSTQFSTTVAGEQSVSCAERVDTAEDVENFFFGFEPDEYLRQSGVQVAGADRTQLAAELYTLYEVKVRDILQALATHRESLTHSQADVPASKTLSATPSD